MSNIYPTLYVYTPVASSTIQGVFNITWSWWGGGDYLGVKTDLWVTYDNGVTYTTIGLNLPGQSVLYDFRTASTHAIVAVQSHNNGVSNIAYSGAFTVTTPPPYAPSLLPNQPFEKSTSHTFNWVHHDGGTFTSGSARQVEISNATTGATAVDTGKEINTSPDYILPPNTLVNDQRYQWRVTTWDQSNNQGMTSAWQVFYTSSLPVITITAPSAPLTYVSDDKYDVVWTYSQAGGSLQTSYQVIVTLTSTGAVLYDSGLLYDSAIRTHQVADMYNSVSNTITVTSTSAMGLASVPVSQTMLPDYLPPDAPIVTVVQVFGGTRFDIVNPGVTAYHRAPDYNQLWSTNSGNGHHDRPDGDLGYLSSNGYYLLMDHIPLNTTVYDYGIVSNAAAGAGAKSETYFVRAVVA